MGRRVSPGVMAIIGLGLPCPAVGGVLVLTVLPGGECAVVPLRWTGERAGARS